MSCSPRRPPGRGHPADGRLRQGGRAGRGHRRPPRRCCWRPKTCASIAFSARSEGPVVTGSVQPERRADLRAEVSSVVLQVLKDNGEPVKRGDLLVRLDDTSIRDGLAFGRRGGARHRAGVRPGRAPGAAPEDAAGPGHDVDAGARGRRGAAQQRAERARRGARAPGVGAPDAAAHRGARAVRRRGQRPQGLVGRHRAGGQGAAQGDRSAHHALRGAGVGRPHERAEDRPARELSRQRLCRHRLRRHRSSASMPPPMR